MAVGNGQGWERYGKAVVATMADVLENVADDHHALLLETADYWLSLGLAIAVTEPDKGNELLSLIETEEGNRTELVADGEEFVRAAIG
jgi:hypothetical protein